MGSAILVVALGCGDNARPSTEISSGSRLKLQWYEYEGGGRSGPSSALFDRHRNEECSPTSWSDGLTYCTPAAFSAVYVTADCTTALGRVFVGDGRIRTPRYFVREFGVATRSYASRLHVPGPPAVAPAQIWRLRDNHCDGPEPAPAGYEYYELAAEVARSELVQIKQLESIDDGRLEVFFATSDDGLRAPAAIRDQVHGVECMFESRPNRSMTECIPRPSTRTTFFRDPQCTELGLSVAGGTVPETAATYSITTGCTSYHAVRAEPISPILYRKTETDCVLFPAPSDERVYATGPALALAAAPRGRGGAPADRLQPNHVEVGEVRLHDHSMYDETLGADCTRQELADGIARCLPASTTGVFSRFADETCRTPVLIAEVPERECDLISPFAYRYLAADHFEVHALAAPYTDPLYHVSTAETCLPYSLLPGFVAHAVGPAIPVESFPAATLVVDP